MSLNGPCAWTTAAVRTRPAEPGTARRTVATITLLSEPLPKMPASPTRAIRPWTATREISNAIERAWLNPSATRMRRKASLSSRPRRMRLRVIQASSPDRSGFLGRGERCS